MLNRNSSTNVYPLLLFIFCFVVSICLFTGILKENKSVTMLEQHKSESTFIDDDIFGNLPVPENTTYEIESDSDFPELTASEEIDVDDNTSTDKGETQNEIDDNIENTIEETLLPETLPTLDAEVDIIPRTGDLGNWTNYNGIIFGNATLYDTTSGGGLAVGGNLTIHNDLAIGSTYTGLYDSTLHIGEYKNEAKFPALLFGGAQLTIGPAVDSLSVYGGSIAMTAEMLDYNVNLETGFIPGVGSGYEAINPEELSSWFSHQHQVVTATSDYLGYGNSVSITLDELGSGSYLDYGSDYFKNQFFPVNGEIYENALLINVKTDGDVNFGQWWPVHSIITIDVNWAIEYDLVVFNFPDAVNITMNSSAFQIQNMSHWSTTVDAWIGERGMAERQALSEKVVYNFPRAQSIEASQSLIQGTILAPRATFTGIGHGDAGHIYGHIIANHYVSQGNFTIHAFHLTSWVYDLVDDALNNNSPTGTLYFRQYLYFSNQPTQLRIGSSQYIILNAAGNYYAGNGRFTQDIDMAIVCTSSADGDTAVHGLPYGNYILQCIATETGFLINTQDPDLTETFYQLSFQINNENDVVSLIHYAEPAHRTVYFQKIDSQTGSGLAGAGFTIAREGDEYDNTTVGNSYLSDGDGRFASHSLPVGTYHLMEVAVPDGYQIIEEGKFWFQIYWDEADSSLKVRDAQGNQLDGSAENPILIANLPGSFANTLLIVKYASQDVPVGLAYTLPDVLFTLYQYQTSTAAWLPVTENLAGESFQIVTNSLGYFSITGLPAGTFRLVEEQPAPGYQLANIYSDENFTDVFPNGYAYEFHFTEAPAIHVAAVANKNFALDISLNVSGKYLEQQIPLSGASFRLEQLRHGSSVWEEVLYSASTGSDGILVLKNLDIGSYRLSQLNATIGYRALEDGPLLFQLQFLADGTPILSAAYNGQEVSGDTRPIALERGGNITFHVYNPAISIGYSVYKINGDAPFRLPGEKLPYYLEGAWFRLKRRASTRSPWEDYGNEFVSSYQYDSLGNPVVDSNNNHIAQAVFPGELLYGEYILAEIQPPPGYTAGSHLNVTFNDGTEGKQVHLFYISESMAESGTASYYVAADYALKDTMTFQFRKVDMQQPDLPLTGSRFVLYSCDLDHIHDESIFSGACWTVNTPLVKESDIFGLVSFPELISGDYLLSEVRAPAGYRRPVGQWLITLTAPEESWQIRATAATVPAFMEMEGGEVKLQLPNQKNYELPPTGSNGRFAFFGSGSLLMLVAIVFYSSQFFKRRENPL